MYDIVPLFGKVVVVILAIAILVFVTLLCMTRRPRASGEHSGQASYRRMREDTVLNDKTLCAELKSVTDWHRLGINLGVPADELTIVENGNQSNNRRKARMLNLWLRCTPNATWEDVVSALEEMGENRVAENIRHNYIRERSKL